MSRDHHLEALIANYRPAGLIADRIFPVKTIATAAGLPLFALKADVTIEDRSNADPIFIQQLEEGKVIRLMDALFLDWEVRMANLLRNVGMKPEIPYTTWTDYDKSDPLGDVQYLREQIAGPATVLFSGTAWRHFRRNEKIIAQTCKKDSGVYPSTAQIETMLEARVLVGNAWYNAATEAQGLRLAQIWGNAVWVYGEGLGDVERGGRINVHRYPYDTQRHCDEIEVSYNQAERIVAPYYGRMIGTVTGASSYQKPTQNPSERLAELAEQTMARLNLTYSQAAQYVLKTDPVLAQEYRNYTLGG